MFLPRLQRGKPGTEAGMPGTNVERLMETIEMVKKPSSVLWGFPAARNLQASCGYQASRLPGFPCSTGFITQ